MFWRDDVGVGCEVCKATRLIADGGYFSFSFIRKGGSQSPTVADKGESPEVLVPFDPGGSSLHHGGNGSIRPSYHAVPDRESAFAEGSSRHKRLSPDNARLSPGKTGNTGVATGQPRTVGIVGLVPTRAVAEHRQRQQTSTSTGRPSPREQTALSSRSLASSARSGRLCNSRTFLGHVMFHHALYVYPSLSGPRTATPLY